MPRRRVCACGCSQPIPKGRKKYAAAECAKRGEQARVRARRPQREYGSSSGGLVYVPGHPLAGKNGTTTARRVEMYDARDGVCICDATGSPAEWSNVRVVEVGDSLMVLCHMHASLNRLASDIVARGFGGELGVWVAEQMGRLWVVACPPPEESSVPEGEGYGGGGPLGSPSPLPVSPSSQVEV